MKHLFWGQYELLRPAQIEAIRAEHPIAYVPWGALEWHSYHNPIGLDGMQAHGQCTALARHTGGVVLPPIYVGTETIKPYKGFPHTIEHSVDTVRQLASEFLEQLAEEGFRVLVLLTGHAAGAHVDALKEAGEAFNANHPDVGCWVVASFDLTEDAYPPNHAAREETSLQLLFKPEVVDLSLLPDDREPTLDDDGVWGKDPRRASAEEGGVILDLFVERALPHIQQLLDQYAS